MCSTTPARVAAVVPAYIVLLSADEMRLFSHESLTWCRFKCKKKMRRNKDLAEEAKFASDSLTCRYVLLFMPCLHCCAGRQKRSIYVLWHAKSNVKSYPGEMVEGRGRTDWERKRKRSLWWTDSVRGRSREHATTLLFTHTCIRAHTHMHTLSLPVSLRHHPTECKQMCKSALRIFFQPAEHAHILTVFLISSLITNTQTQNAYTHTHLRSLSVAFPHIPLRGLQANKRPQNCQDHQAPWEPSVIQHEGGGRGKGRWWGRAERGRWEYKREGQKEVGRVKRDENEKRSRVAHEEYRMGGQKGT